MIDPFSGLLNVVGKSVEAVHEAADFNHLTDFWQTFDPSEQAELLSWDELQDSNGLAWGSECIEEGLTTTVEVNGYQYELDSLGRTIQVSGELRLDEAERNMAAQLDAGHADRLVSDDGGHLIASEFGGSGEWINLVPMDAHSNRWGDYRALELELKHHVEDGQTVYYENQIAWDGDGYRPAGFEIEYSIDGEAFHKTVGNALFEGPS
jgi:hypothetical protein